MKYAFVIAAIFCGLCVGCSEEKREPLPDLPPIEIPKEVFGYYTGRMPCDDCEKRALEMDLFDDGKALVVETVVKGTTRVDTLRGSFTYADSVVNLSLSDNSIHWAFKRDKVGNLALMKSGNVYRDADGLKAVMIRFYKRIKL